MEVFSGDKFLPPADVAYRNLTWDQVSDTKGVEGENEGENEGLTEGSPPRPLYGLVQTFAEANSMTSSLNKHAGVWL